ncbi:hypothetical protein [Microbacterium terricola]|uniref:Uncharacterized protein n=1 Tax=Microbacterium terricola TaxID=344163 RepID=A0ABM8E351_9MICO|nr:hypothetical protein [Microbacterium terricola]UYK40154.1 hypothetical protein OAU46_00455 [Microbacterium terricola]BDV32141.1 hypothetical protein Microterr_28010 [Microbacterium terricola]
MIPPDWTPHRRDDGELVGWIRPAGDDWAAVDLFGRDVSEAVDWLDAEAVLEAHGIGWLADIWMLDGRADAPLRVRVVEVTPGGSGEAGRVVVKLDDGGAVGGPPTRRFTLPWPAPATLRPPRQGDPSGLTLFG